MGNIRFKGVEEVSGFKIPFSLDEDSLSNWLHDLLSLKHSESILKLFFLIETLNKTKLPAQQRLQFLQKIFTYLCLINEQIEKRRLELEFPLSEQENALLEKVVWCYLSVARGLNFAAKQMDEKEMKTSAWYQALFSLSQAYLIMSSVYCLPSKDFWTLCYYIYSSAENEAVLFDSVDDVNKVEQTIGKIFKQILVFSFVDSDQFRSGEMKTIFSFLGKYTNQVNIELAVKESRKKGVFVFDFTQDLAPVTLAGLDGFVAISSTRYIAPIALAKKIFEGIQQEKNEQGVIKSINQELFMRLIKTLGMAQKRQFNRRQEKGRSKGIIGLDYLTRFLRNNNGEKNVKEENKDEELELVSRKEEHSHLLQSRFKKQMEGNEQLQNILKVSAEMDHGEGVWGSVPEETNFVLNDVNGSEFSLINSSVKGYAIGWNSVDDKAKLGDVFGVISSNLERLEIAIVRRISQLDNLSVQLGLEVISFESEAVLVTRGNEKGQGKWCLLLPAVKALKQAESMVFNAGDYAVNEFIFLEQDKQKQKYRVAKILNSTASITQVELFCLDNENTVF